MMHLFQFEHQSLHQQTKFTHPQVELPGCHGNGLVHHGLLTARAGNEGLLVNKPFQKGTYFSCWIRTTLRGGGCCLPLEYWLHLVNLQTFEIESPPGDIQLHHVDIMLWLVKPFIFFSCLLECVPSRFLRLSVCISVLTEILLDAGSICIRWHSIRF